jgi:hypothetical protein
MRFSPVLALLGAQALATAAEVVVARWDGGELTLSRFLDRLALERLKVELHQGKPLPEDHKAQVAAAVLDGIVGQEVFRVEAKRRKIRVRAGEVNAQLRAFGQVARMSRAELGRRLTAIHATEAALRESLASSLLLRKVAAAERARIRVTAADLAQARTEARWRGEGHFSDRRLRARLVERRLGKRMGALAESLRASAHVQVFLKAEDALADGARREVETKALAFYREHHPGAPADLLAEVTPMGCHSEVTIRRGPQKLSTLGYADGKIFELGKK